MLVRQVFVVEIGSIDEEVSPRCKLRKAGDCLRFVCKEIALSELNLLDDGKTLKVVLCTKFCPLCNKQVIASALGQIRINFT